MRAKQILLITFGISLTCALYLFGKTRFPEGKAKMDGAGVRDKRRTGSMDFPKLLELATTTLNEKQSKQISSLNNQLSVAKNRNDSIQIMNQLGRDWTYTQNLLVAGSYYMQVAEKNNSQAYWDTASQLFSIGYKNTRDTAARQYGVDHALTAFQKLRKLDPSNIDYTISYAYVLIDGNDEVMSGVTLLRELDAKDPDNIQVNLILGSLDIRNGELQKAENRLKKVIKLDPDNINAYFYLADCYRAMGKTDKAIEQLEQCKLISHDDDINKEIDTAIKNLKTNKS